MLPPSNSNNDEDSDIEFVILPKPKRIILDLTDINDDDKDTNETHAHSSNSNSRKRPHSSIVSNSDLDDFNHEPNEKRFRKTSPNKTVIKKERMHIQHKNESKSNSNTNEHEIQVQSSNKNECKSIGLKMDISRPMSGKCVQYNGLKSCALSPGLNYGGFCSAHNEATIISKGFGSISPLADVKSNFMRCRLPECHGQQFELLWIYLSECSAIVEYQMVDAPVQNVSQYVVRNSDYRVFGDFEVNVRKNCNSRVEKGNQSRCSTSNQHMVFDENQVSHLKFHVQ